MSTVVPPLSSSRIRSPSITRTVGARMVTVPMRTDCKNYESRTYPSGETVRKCNIDLAPEAPWRCPNPCSGYEPRLADVNWAHGRLVSPPTPDEPEGEAIAELLDDAEDIVNAALPEALEEAERREGRRPWWKRLRRG